MHKYASILIVMVILIIALAGCTEVIKGGSGSPFGSLDGMKPGPTQTLPPGQEIEIQINEKDTSYGTITVLFAGGRGQIMVSSIRVVVTRPDGQVLEGSLAPEKGAELRFPGSKDTDRIEVYVTLTNGSTYKIIDRLLPYRTRG